MLSREIEKLEHENRILKDALEELKEKMQQDEVAKPKSCKYCVNYIQHYGKGLGGCPTEYSPINFGHCISGVPVGKGGKKSPVPDDTCPYFEIGTHNMRNL